jgi:hypothetical protein
MSSLRLPLLILLHLLHCRRPRRRRPGCHPRELDAGKGAGLVVSEEVKLDLDSEGLTCRFRLLDKLSRHILCIFSRSLKYSHRMFVSEYVYVVYHDYAKEYENTGSL